MHKIHLNNFKLHFIHYIYYIKLFKGATVTSPWTRRSLWCGWKAQKTHLTDSVCLGLSHKPNQYGACLGEVFVFLYLAVDGCQATENMNKRTVGDCMWKRKHCVGKNCMLESTWAFDCQCCCGHLVFSSIPSLIPTVLCTALNYSCFQYLFFHVAVGAHCIPTVSMSLWVVPDCSFKDNLGDGKRTFQMYLWPIFMAL